MKAKNAKTDRVPKTEIMMRAICVYKRHHQISGVLVGGASLYRPRVSSRCMNERRSRAGVAFELLAGGRMQARVQDKAEMMVGSLDLQALASVSILSGDDTELSVDGDIGTVATGAVDPA